MNIFPLIAVGTCTTNLNGEILEVRYEQIRLKNDKTIRLPEGLSNPPPLYDESSSYDELEELHDKFKDCLLYTSPSPRDATLSRMPSSA